MRNLLLALLCTALASCGLPTRVEDVLAPTADEIRRNDPVASQFSLQVREYARDETVGALYERMLSITRRCWDRGHLRLYSDAYDAERGFARIVWRVGGDGPVLAIATFRPAQPSGSVVEVRGVRDFDQLSVFEDWLNKSLSECTKFFPQRPDGSPAPRP